MLPSIPELEIFGVYDRAMPNLERIVLRPLITLDLSHYALTLGIRSANGSAWPTIDHYLWLGNTVVAPPAWVFIYTGRGQHTVSHELTTKEPVHALHWNKKTVVLQDPNVIPVLLRLDGVQIGNQPPRTLNELLPYQTSLPLSLLGKK